MRPASKTTPLHLDLELETAKSEALRETPQRATHHSCSRRRCEKFKTGLQLLAASDVRSMGEKLRVRRCTCAKFASTTFESVAAFFFDFGARRATNASDLTDFVLRKALIVGATRVWVGAAFGDAKLVFGAEIAKKIPHKNSRIRCKFFEFFDAH